MALVFVLLGGAVAVHAGQGDDLRDRADQLETGLRDIAESEDAVVLELFALESELARASERLRELEAQAGRVSEATELAREQTQIARRAVETAESNLAQRLRTLYVTNDIDTLDVFLGASSIQDAVDGLGALERTASHDERLLEQVAGARRTAIELRDDLRRKQRRVDGLVADARTARQNLTRVRADRTDFLRTLRRDLELGRREVASLRREAVALEARAAEVRAAAEAEAEAQQVTQAAPTPEASAPPPEAAAPAPSPAPAPAPSPSSSPPASPPPGPPASPPPAPPGGPGAGSQMTVLATAYAIQGTTAVGVQTQPGIVAVDPNVIPLGSKMFIPGYGEGVAADTGSAVKGAIIDVWLPTVEEALAWGRRTVTITFR